KFLINNGFENRNRLLLADTAAVAPLQKHPQGITRRLAADVSTGDPPNLRVGFGGRRDGAILVIVDSGFAPRWRLPSRKGELFPIDAVTHDATPSPESASLMASAAALTVG